MQRRHCLLKPLAWVIGVSGWSAATGHGPLGSAIAQTPGDPGPVVLPVPGSLQLALASALKAGQPLVLMVSLDGCPFCKIARENYLSPLIREQGLLVVQINMQHRVAVKDIRGRDTTHAQLIADLNVTVAPTLLFYGPGGAEVAPRLEGMGSQDFYGAYLEQRVAAARKQVR